MIGASKILTVSYGTFSCTLEGFDDPFNTMKAIAEYFRDLAAEDRYFGAEPPTPDAAMLHKIAEREIQRRVEAKIQENGVILRAGDIEVQAPVPAPAVLQAAPEATPAPAVAAQESAPPVESSEIAAKLSRIRNAVSHARQDSAPALAAASVVAPVEYVEDEVAPAAIAPEAAFVDVEFAEAEPDAGFDVPLESLELPDLAPVAEPIRNADLDDFDLGLDDIDLGDEALDATAPVAVAEEPSEDEDELNGLLASLVLDSAPAAPVAEVAEQAPEQAAAVDLEDDDLAGMLAGLADPVEARAEAVPEFEAVQEFEDNLSLEEDLSLEDDLGLEEDLDLEEDLADLRAVDALPEADDLPEDTDPLAGIAAALEAETPIPAPAAVAASAQVNERIERARARVIRIRRTPPVDATPVETTDLPQNPAPAADPVATALSPEAEADLMRELAEVRAEAALAPAVPQAVAPVRPVRPVRPQRVSSGPVTPPPAAPLGPDAGEESVTRLLAETNSQMEGPESRRRLAAIQHLKAAVAATVAERRAGVAKPANPEERMDPYRADLSQIVRSEGDTTVNRPSPLVLVSEQRIDRSLAADAAAAPASNIVPVRPQRVATEAVAQVIELDEDEELDIEDEDDNIFDDRQGFADFAERLGAQGLPALLEAAAAYSACVEGRPHFSRPQIMRQIAGADTASSNSREDGLRSFGTLLRDGKIVKVRRGQYALSEGSHYLAEARKLVG